MELAQLICERSTELSGANKPGELYQAAATLTRAAGQQTVVLRHAATIFRSRLRRDPTDAKATDGLRLLNKVLALLN